jgi:hypothetical protein
MRGPEIPASVGTHLEAGFRLPNKHEHLDDLSLNAAATNAPEGQLLNSLLLPPEYNHSYQYEECSKKNGLRTVNRDPISVMSASTSAPTGSAL